MGAIYHYCCKNLQELGDNGYIDGELLYLQGIGEKSSLPAHLRHYQFCLTCGQANLGHPDNIAACNTLRFGLEHNQFRQTGNEFIFNLKTKEESRQSQASSIDIRYCPYCSKKYVKPTYPF